MSLNWKRGYVHVYTGDGKGKTTAAAGLALRAAEAGIRVFIGQFMKAEPSGEITALGRLGSHVTVRLFGAGDFVRVKPSRKDVRAAVSGLKEAADVLAAGQYGLVVLDEVNVAVKKRLFPVERVLELIALKPPHVELVLTGRDANPRITERADLVTDMRAVKHYYDKGVRARKGIGS
jgi:cob(I)alamin adenosyltransferase